MSWGLSCLYVWFITYLEVKHRRNQRNFMVHSEHGDRYSIFSKRLLDKKNLSSHESMEVNIISMGWKFSKLDTRSSR